MDNSHLSRDQQRLVFQVMVPAEGRTPAQIRTQMREKITAIAQAAGVVAFDVKVRNQRFHQLLVLVPRSLRGAGSIAVGSGIVGQLVPNPNPVECMPYVHIYYEGAVHQQQMSFEDKVFHAASRMVERYPTIAHSMLRFEDLKIVGYYLLREDYQEKFLHVFDPDALEEWQEGSGLYDLKKGVNRYAVDLPDPDNLGGEMTNVGYFETKQQAIDWAHENIGTDQDGTLNVVSRMPEEDDEDSDEEDERYAELEQAKKENFHGEYAAFPRSDWQYEVQNGDTQLGYWEWAEHKIEGSSDDEDEGDDEV